jgi:ComF family protein
MENCREWSQTSLYEVKFWISRRNFLVLPHVFRGYREIAREISMDLNPAIEARRGRYPDVWATLFPPICLGCNVLLRHDLPLALCTRCRPLQARLPDTEPSSIQASWAYDGPLARAVVALKFEGALAFAGPLGRLLAEEPGLLAGPDGAPHDLIVPVPLHWRRRLARGFDQSEELARWALVHARRRGMTVPALGHRVLARVRATAPQTKLDADARAANLEAAFLVRRPELVSGRRVLLIDDVTTTGATARACVRALAEAGSQSVHALALLRTV